MATEHVGVRDIADMLGLSPQRAHQITRQQDFPEPRERLRMGPIWKRAEVEAWARSVGRAVNPGAATT